MKFEVSELEAGWRILVGKELQRKGAAELKKRLPVSSLTGGRRRVSYLCVHHILQMSQFLFHARSDTTQAATGVINLTFIKIVIMMISFTIVQYVAFANIYR